MKRVKNFVPLYFLKNFFAGISIILSIAFINSNSNCFAQTSNDTKQQIDDLNTEIILIREIENAIAPVLKTHKLSIKVAKKLNAAVDKFETFQQGNGGNYIFDIGGFPSYQFHVARGVVNGIGTEIRYLKKMQARSDIPTESLNYLQEGKDRLTKIRTKLINSLKVITEDFKRGY